MFRWKFSKRLRSVGYNPNIFQYIPFISTSRCNTPLIRSPLILTSFQQDIQVAPQSSAPERPFPESNYKPSTGLPCNSTQDSSSSFSQFQSTPIAMRMAPREIVWRIFFWKNLLDFFGRTTSPLNLRLFKMHTKKVTQNIFSQMVGFHADEPHGIPIRKESHQLNKSKFRVTYSKPCP